MSFFQGDPGAPQSSSPCEFGEDFGGNSIFRDSVEDATNLEWDGGCYRKVEMREKFPVTNQFPKTPTPHPWSEAPSIRGTFLGAEVAQDNETMNLEDSKEPASFHNLRKTPIAVSSNHPSLPHPPFLPQKTKRKRPVNQVSAIEAGRGSQLDKFKMDRKQQKRRDPPPPASPKKKFYLYNFNIGQIKDEAKRIRVVKAQKCKSYREEMKKKSQTNDRVCLKIYSDPNVLKFAAILMS